MGYELDAFIGKIADLQGWKKTLPSAVVADVIADVGLVPMTLDLYQDLRAIPVLQPEQTRSPGGTALSFRELGYVDAGGWDLGPLFRWAQPSSRGTTLGFLTARYFGDEGDERAYIWVDGRMTNDRATGLNVLEALGVSVAPGTEITERGGILGVNTRGWASAAILGHVTKQAGDPIAALAETLVFRCLDKEVQRRVRSGAACALGEKGPAAAAAVPALTEALNDADDLVRQYAAEALKAIGQIRS